MEEVKEAINELFEAAEHQEQVLVGIYKLYIKDWDVIGKIHGWPACGKKMWCWVCGKFQEFDQSHHPEVLPGGAWMNTGFSSDKNLKDWEVSLDNCSFRYKKGGE